jgi:3',5'-cyclic AMP phosphodiesterase CpdA
LSAWSWRWRRKVQRPEILDALVADLRRHPVDHFVITGDLVNFSLPEEFRRAATWLEALAGPECVSIVPGNHDALVPLAEAEGLGRWDRWTRVEAGWPFVHHRGNFAFIGLRSAWPTAPLLASGGLGAAQLARLEKVLMTEGSAGRSRIVLLHHPVADGAVSARRALRDRARLRAVLARAGAELILHGHARDARLDSVRGPLESIPCVCVPSSSALPNPHDEGARWHHLRLPGRGEPALAQVRVRRWSVPDRGFVDAATYELCLPRLQPQARPGRGLEAGGRS